MFVVSFEEVFCKRLVSKRIYFDKIPFPNLSFNLNYLIILKTTIPVFKIKAILKSKHHNIYENKEFRVYSIKKKIEVIVYSSTSQSRPDCPLEGHKLQRN